MGSILVAVRADNLTLSNLGLESVKVLAYSVGGADVELLVREVIKLHDPIRVVLLTVRTGGPLLDSLDVANDLTTAIPCSLSVLPLLADPDMVRDGSFGAAKKNGDLSIGHPLLVELNYLIG